jgi:ribosomal protein S18 acetylase RimI-like enzyme
MGLHTNERNESGQALYRKAGFEPQSEPRWQEGREVYWVRSIAPS